MAGPGPSRNQKPVWETTVALLWATGHGQVLERHYEASSIRTELGEDRSRQGVWIVEEAGKASTLGAVITYVGC